MTCIYKHNTFVSTVVEYIESLNSRRAFLFVSEYQIYPVVEISGHMFGLQRLAMLVNKVLRWLCPTRQHNMVDSLTREL